MQMFRHVVPEQATQPVQRMKNEADEESDEVMFGTNERSKDNLSGNKKKALGSASPGTKMKQSVKKQSMFGQTNQQSVANSSYIS